MKYVWHPGFLHGKKALGYGPGMPRTALAQLRAPAPPPPGPPGARAVLWRWWCTCHGAGAVLPPSRGYGEHVQGGTEEWPEWASVTILADAASVHSGVDINTSVMGTFIRAALPDIKFKHRLIEERKRGILVRRRTHTMYQIGPFRENPLTDRPSAW